MYTCTIINTYTHHHTHTRKHTQAEEDVASAGAGVNPESEMYLRKLADKIPDLGRKFEYLLNTGNLVSKNTGDLTQTSGFTVRTGKGHVSVSVCVCMCLGMCARCTCAGTNGTYNLQ
jgi:hypothetical protein